MTTFEVELEREKLNKIAQVAAQAADAASELGREPEAAEEFLSHYFRHVDAVDMEERRIDDLLGLVRSHYRLAMQRPAARATIMIRTPTRTDHGWQASGATVVQIVTDDRPFLVDSVTMEVLRQGWSIREVFHPQFLVRRDVRGRLLDILHTSEAGDDAGLVAESWMHLEILRPNRPDEPAALAAALEDGLLEVLRLVEEAVEDWAKMRTRAEETLGYLDGLREADSRSTEVASARELLGWLSDNHFTFLGYREYSLVGGRDDARLEPVSGTGLGILRADQDPPGAFHALPQPGTAPALMIITKDNFKSRVHRPAYLDYIGVRTFAPDGTVAGEFRFLGLFASSAYSESVSQIPVLRQKAIDILALSGYDDQSHGGKAILDVLNTYPRDELFQTSVTELAPVVEKVAHLKERRQVRMFVRRDPYGRYLSCLVFLPRDRYTTAVRKRMEALLLSRFGGASIDYTARVSESVLARLHFVVRMALGVQAKDLDVRELEKELTLATRSWDDQFADQLASVGARDQLSAIVASLPEGYKEIYTPKQALQDLQALMALTDEQSMSMALYVPDSQTDVADLRLKIFRRDGPISLSKVLPHLSLLGVDVIDERPHELPIDDQERGYIYDFGLAVPGGAEAVARRWTSEARKRFMEAFAASYSGSSEPDAFNALVMRAEMSWRQVAILRAVGRYLRQAGTTYSQTYIAQALCGNVDIARSLVNLFEVRFDPSLNADVDARKERGQKVVGMIRSALDDVASLDHDRIVRSYLAVITAVIRTNAYLQHAQALTLKLLPRQIPDLPEPRPAFEVFVYSPRFEGVHLRFGPVARGGLRWSDRAEDFRTEVLGLVKAQMVKNTVIVPVGAKGGFYCKRLPDPTVDRDGWLAEGIACYRLFIGSLLEITDNLRDQQVVPPEGVLRYDDDDPYLVVAADKGTATFSDIANEISIGAGFWLGDAFASGGSAGYDHKGMGITARGAWESVRRHFREMGVDCQTTDFTCVGIGDMSGDVFGNGMLLSKHIKLVAAFDHRHVFIDPDPDPELSWRERARMFALARSSWADYDQSLISAGGGVFPRTVKSVELTPQMRACLGIADDVQRLAPTELITACLKAPVDLLWNGGIGTYVKGSGESHADAGDKANDVLRVDGLDLRARAVGEGGNLGLTQLGRIEYAGRGGRINTDFIDNSAGVDTSDHEVNIKILLTTQMTAGRLDGGERDRLLASMTDEVAAQVLENNYDQNLALANSVSQAVGMAGVHEDWMRRLEDDGTLDREIEFLPTAAQMKARRAQRQGLTSPELATLLAYTKIALKRDVLASDLPDDPYLADLLVDYFPAPLRQRYADRMPQHPLNREIITTVAVNRFVNTSGITCFSRLSAETGASAAEVIRAQVAARSIFDVASLEKQIRRLDYTLDAQVQTTLRLEVRTLVERAIRWLINNRHRPIDVSAAVDQLAAGVQQVVNQVPELVRGREAEAYRARLSRYSKAGATEEVARAAAALPAAYAALAIVQTASRADLDVLRVARTHFSLSQRLGLDRLLRCIAELPRDDRWKTMARAALRDDLHAVHAQLTAQVLKAAHDGEPVDEVVSRWVDTSPAVAAEVPMLETICGGQPDLARVSVGLRIVRGMLPADD
ncbi:MAG TPA: NAD-glutamate dehydrogenase [Dermatophilaceae bacterium]|nr:NAD-glutamate dehydrogenase [Dermatophilaceae bacterium]